MKSAYELAMERLGNPIREYTVEQKVQLSEIDKLYESKIAQARFAALDRRQKAGADPEQIKQIQDDQAVEIRSLEERRDGKKNELRKQFDQQG
ncbi:MAG: hypothetical protein KAI66_00025 [Lentisphaeria bacterium]|nr:hypothetical protein [Lentisphaeria bacterium]